MYPMYQSMVLCDALLHIIFDKQFLLIKLEINVFLDIN